MRKVVLLAVSALALAGVGGAAVWHWPIGYKVSPSLSQLSGDAGRGAYLARMSGCIACHTDTEGGGAPLAGGLELDTKFGKFYSPNLTTDKDEGMGDWSVEQFAKAVRQGVSPEGKPYYPAFPYPFYSKFSDQDIADLWAAFKTVPPATKPSAPHELGFPFSMREGLKLWRTAFLDLSGFEVNPDKSEAWNRGKFIVTGPAHCGACHTPRNFAGAREVEEFLHGAKDLPGGGASPPITTAALTKGNWTLEDLAYALKSGILPDGDVFGGSMAEVVRDGTSFLIDDDLTAIATYLMDQDQ